MAELSFQEAVEIIKQRLGASTGRSQKVLRDARASGEVRFRPDPNADYDIFNLPPGTMNKGGVTAVRASDMKEEKLCFSKGDLVDWLDRQAVPARPPAGPEAAGPNGRTHRALDRAKQAIKALWPEGVHSPALLPNKSLCGLVANWLKDDCKARGLPVDTISADTILRAANRKHRRH
jgi:hypothetical protein